MATQQLMAHCSSCDRKTVHLRNRPNHILHLLLSIMTGGIWILVWLMANVFQRGPSCTECGKTKLR